MLNTLTKEQEENISVWRDKYTEIGLSTDRLPSKEEVTEICKEMYEKVLLRDFPGEVVICESPQAAWHEVKKYINEEDPAYINPYFSGAYDSYWVGTYDYYMENTDVKIDEELVAKWQVLKKALILGEFYPLDHVCIVSEKPIEIHLKDGVTHCETGPAIKYSDGFSVYRLNGVDVLDWLVETPAEELKAEQMHSIENADFRTEFVRKFGVDRLIDLGKVVDSYEKYEKPSVEECESYEQAYRDYCTLLEMDDSEKAESPTPPENYWTHKSEYTLVDLACLFESVEYAPHLKMTNQTTGVYHVEAVSPDCRTILDAIKERCGGEDVEIQAIA